MFFHILKRDLKRKKTMNVILLLFIILATMFLASSVNNLIIVNGAVDHFLEISKVPDFFTLAITPKEGDPIEEYLENNENISEYEICNTLNLTNDQVTITKCKQEPGKTKYEKTNTLSIDTVPKNFMKVFQMDGSSLELKQGEIAFSKVEAEANDLEVGDKVKIKIGEVEQEFEIVTILKDAIYGPQMMGFKRHIITEEDFEKYEEQENLLYTRVYSINYKDEDAFEDGWKKQNFNVISNVEKDMVQTSYVMDMLVAGTLIIVSICLILIAFLVLRFTIVFTLQEDYKEIGIMKAIGMRDLGIKGIYLVKYLVISVIGGVIGFGLSFPFGEMFLEKAIVNIHMDKTEKNYFINLACVIAVVLIVLAFCYLSTNKLKKFSAMDAIRNGSNGERYQAKSHLKLWKRRRMKPAFYMALNDIMSSFKRFLILGVTFCIGTMLILLPLTALNTLKDENIVEFFSLCPSDVYINNSKAEEYVSEEDMDLLLEDLEQMEEKLKEHGIRGMAGADMGYIVPCYAGDSEEIYSYYTMQEVGSWDRSYKLLEGKEPVLDNELMITNITAKEMGVSIGDNVYFKYKDRIDEYVITGTYQSMVNMGNGFRVSRDARIDYEYTAGILCVQVEIPEMESEEACEKLEEIFPDYKIYDGREFMDTMVGGITDQMDVMMIFIVAIVLIINSLITVLMMKTIMTKERGDIALLKSMGFRNSAVKAWQTARIFMILIAAIMLGTLLSNLTAPFVIGPIYAMMGADKIELVMNPLEAYVIYPLLLLTVTGLSAVICAGDVKRVDLKEVNNME